MTAFFTMYGPEFLVVYLVIGIVTIALVSSAIKTSEEQLAHQETRLRDPYLIAHLRGDVEELVRVVVVSLMMRRLPAMRRTRRRSRRRSCGLYATPSIRRTPFSALTITRSLKM